MSEIGVINSEASIIIYAIFISANSPSADKSNRNRYSFNIILFQISNIICIF